MFDNNPASSALVEARRLFPNDTYLIISIGTGTSYHTLNINKVKKYGTLEWLSDLVDVFMDGSSQKTHYQLNELLDNNFYFRFQISLNNACMDDVSIDFLNNLQLQVKKQIVDQRMNDLHYICSLLAT